MFLIDVECATALYGPLNRHANFSVIVTTRIRAGTRAGTNSLTYQAKCIGYKGRRGGPWELLGQTTAAHMRAVWALEDLLRSIRNDLGLATCEYTSV